MDTIDQHSRGEFFALVSYVPEPLGAKIDALKSSFSGERLSRAHITLLPPRPLRHDPAVAYERIREVLAGFPAFEVVLTDVCRFPSTDVLYLSLGKGQEQIFKIYRALNRDEFFHREEFEFLPHLTLAYPVDSIAATEMSAAMAKSWEELRHLQPFVIDRAVFLSRTSDGGWNQQGEHSLSTTPP